MDASNSKQREHSLTQWVGGVTFTFVIAAIGYVLAKLPGFSLIGQLAASIIIAVIYRQFFGYPEQLRLGITFSTKRLLRFAIILYGLKLNIETILQDGVGLLAMDALVIAFAIFLMILLAKWLKADKNISLLLGIGTGVCGAAAIAAVAPIIKTDEEDTAIGVGIIALVGTIFAIVYTIVRPFLPFSGAEYGIWSGMSLHEIAHVALATAPGGSDALAMGLLAKLGRVFLLIPLCFILIYIINRKKDGGKRKTKIEFPWFLLGFIFMSVIGSYVLGPVIPVSATILNGISQLTTWCLTAAMVGLGLNVSLKDLRTKALRPLLAISMTSILLSMLTYFITALI